MTTFLKGDSSAEISLMLAEGFDYSGKTLCVEYQGVCRRFPNVAAGAVVAFSYSAKETASMSLGAYPVRVWLEGADGSIATVHSGAVKLRVTDALADVRSGEPMYLDVRGGLYGLEGLPARWTETDLRAKINEIIRRLGGAVGVLLALALPAFADALTVHTAPKGAIYNDEQVVTNVTLDASGLATPQDIATATNAALQAAKEYADGAISAAGAVTPEAVTNIVNDIAPTPGDYENVSNKAVNAVQEVVINNVTNKEFVIDFNSGSGTVYEYTDETANDPDHVKIGTLGIWAGSMPGINIRSPDGTTGWKSYTPPPEFIDIYAPTESDPTVPAWAKAAQAPVTSLEPATNYTDSVIAPIWQYVLGDRVWFAVTNYMRTVDGVAPSLQLWEVREGVTNLIYHSTEEMTNLIGKATAPLATTQALDAVRAAMPSKAWSRYQSATGADNPAPADVTIISTPAVQLTGGGEWTPHTLSAGGTVWTLESNGFTSISGGTNGYFSIRNTVTGEEVFSVEERSILPSVPINEAFEAKGSGEGFFYTVYADARPTLYTSTNLTSRAKAAWDAEGDDPNVIVNSWTNNGDGTWTADVTLVVPSVKYFAYVGVHESKDTIISNKRAASFDGGVFIDGVKYRLGTATINGVRVLTAEVIQ